MTTLRIAALLAALSLAGLLLPQAALAQGAADKAEAAAIAECKAKSDPSILVNYWKTAGARSPVALAELEDRAKRICLTQGGGMTVTFSFTPANETSGSMSYSGGGTGGVTMAGQGTYTVTLTEKGGTLTHVSTGRVTNPGGGGATHTTKTTLTRTDPC